MDEEEVAATNIWEADTTVVPLHISTTVLGPPTTTPESKSHTDTVTASHTPTQGGIPDPVRGGMGFQ